MWPPRLAVLPLERPHRSTRCRPQPVELWRPDPEGDAKARHEGRVEKDGYGSSRKPKSLQAVRLRRRQMAKEREMRRQEITLRWEVFAMKSVQPGEAGGVQLGC